MPFKNKAQVKACFAKNDPNWDCHKWADETSDMKSLPEKKKKMKKFSEWLNEEREYDINHDELKITLLKDLIKEILDYANKVIATNRSIVHTKKNSSELMGQSEIAQNIQIRINSAMAEIDRT